jgi:hypothetical protein
VRRINWRCMLHAVRQNICVRTARALCALAVIGVVLVLAPVAGARSGPPMRVLMTTARLRHSHLLAHHGYRQLAHELRAGTPRAHVAIVGGSKISVELAPWQVEVVAFTTVEVDGKEELVVLYCGGSILDETHVLTAGHCVFNPETRERIPADQIVVLAGASDFKKIETTDQETIATEVRVHPYYVFNPEATHATPDDVAVLKLEKSLNVSLPTAKTIAPAVSGTLLREGTQVSLTGFGEQSYSPEEFNGELYSIGMTLVYSRECGGEADALFLCASTPSGSPCLGDSGSGLTLPGSPATLIGVTDTVQVIDGQPCRDGAGGGFANVMAPEIRDFIEGSETPPRAPQGGGAVIRGVTKVGDSLTCEPGNWSNDPTFTYSFIDSSNGQVLQQGSSSTYALTAVDVGRTILCEVQAANAGGTGVGRTPALSAIEATLPPPGLIEALKSIAEAHEREEKAKKAREETERQLLDLGSVQGPTGATTTAPDKVTLAGTNITVQSDGTALVKLNCTASASCHGKLTLTAKSVVKAKGKKEARTVTIGTVGFAAPGAATTTVKIKLNATGRALLSTDHGRLSAGLAVLQLEPGPPQTHTENVQLVQQKARHRK